MGGSKTESAVWDVYARVDGRYKLVLEYAAAGHLAAFTTRTEHMVLDHSYVEELELPTTSNWTDWQRKEIFVDMHIGLNAISIQPVFNDRFLVRTLHVELVKELGHCRPGTRIAIDWGSIVTANENVEVDTSGVQQGALGRKAVLKGGIDLDALGPWTLHFKVLRGAASSNDTVKMTVNNKDVYHVHQTKEASPYDGKDDGGAMHKVFLQDNGGLMKFDIAWQSDDANSQNHIEIGNGYAECRGCTHTHCDLNNARRSGKRLNVVHHTFEKAGKQHMCRWNSVLGACQCQCQKAQFKGGLRWNHFIREIDSTKTSA